MVGVLGETNPASNPADLNCQVSKEIEDEANSYFQRIYNHPPHPTLSIDEILDLLKKFQDSPHKRERVSVRLRKLQITKYSERFNY